VPLSPVSIQTHSLALRALRKRKPQETQALALASSQPWLPLLRPIIPIGWRLRLLRENFTQQTQAIAFEWKPGFKVHVTQSAAVAEILTFRWSRIIIHASSACCRL